MRDEWILRAAQDRGLLTPEQVEASLRQWHAMAAPAGTCAELLAREGLLTTDQIQALAREKPIEESSERRIAALLADDPWPKTGRYDLLGQIGRGATSTVYRAFDTELRRVVALKVVHELGDFSRPLLQRFEREAHTVARLAHPHIVQVYDVGREGENVYLVMELVTGPSLQAVLAEGRSTRDELIRTLEEAARAIHYAHQQGIVHRDLKPGNIMLDPKGAPKIVDFGLAHWADRQTVLTQAGSTLGTPCYMAPEQVRGSREELGPCTDVYALGVILYEILTGRPPFEAPTLPAFYDRILHEDAAPPRRIARDVPEGLERVCLKAIEKEPTRRYATAQEFADELRRYREHQPVLALAPSSLYRLYRRVRRNVLAWGLGAAVVAAVSAASFLSWTGREQTMQFRAEGREARLKELRNTLSTAVEAALRHRRIGNNAQMKSWEREGVRAWQEAVALDPRAADLEYWKGSMNQVLMQEARALDAHERALAKSPRHLPALYERLLLLFSSYGAALLEACRRSSLLDDVPTSSMAAPRKWNREEIETHWPELARRRGELLREAERLEQEFLKAPEGAELLRTGAIHLAIVRGIRGASQGNEHEALEAFREAARDPQLEYAWRQVGWILTVRGWFSKDEKDRRKLWADARNAYTRGLERDLGYVPHYLGRGQVLQDWAFALTDPELWSAADKDYSKALELDPASVEAWTARGIERLQRATYQGRHGQEPREGLTTAEGDFSEAIRLDPAWGAAWLGRGRVRLQRAAFLVEKNQDPGEAFAGAEQDFENALRQNGNRLETLNARGQLHARRAEWYKNREDPLPRWAAGERDLDEALTSGPSFSGIWFRRGDLRLDRALFLSRKNASEVRRNAEGAQCDFLEAVRLNPTLEHAMGGRLKKARSLSSTRDER